MLECTLRMLLQLQGGLEPVNKLLIKLGAPSQQSSSRMQYSGSITYMFIKLKTRLFEDSPNTNHPGFTLPSSSTVFNPNCHNLGDTFLISHPGFTGDLRLPLRPVETSNALATGRDHSSSCQHWRALQSHTCNWLLCKCLGLMKAPTFRCS